MVIAEQPGGTVIGGATIDRPISMQLGKISGLLPFNDPNQVDDHWSIDCSENNGLHGILVTGE
jgi:hypothetical protein